MSPTGRQSGPNLRILLEDSPYLTYSVGDVIIGKVVRKAPVVTATGTVVINLFAQAKNKFSPRSGHHESATYQSHFELISSVQQRLHHGPLHVAPDGDPAEWPFSITIPDRPSPRAVAMGHTPESSYISLDRNEIATQPLPGSFDFACAGGFTGSFYAYIEYFLVAELRQAGTYDGAKASLPLQVRWPAPLAPVSDFQLKRIKVKSAVSTLRLVPAMEDTGLSFKQKAKQLFGSSKLPRYSFILEQVVPTVIQFSHPMPIPFYLRVIPEPELTSEIIRDVPQRVVLTDFSLELKATTMVMASGGLTSRPQTQIEYTPIDLGMKLVLPQLKQEGDIVLPMGAKVEHINLGEHLGLRIDAYRSYALGRAVRQFGREVPPTFTSYNVMRMYSLRWEVTMEIAGETHKVSGERIVQLVGESQEQVQRQLASQRRQWLQRQQPVMTTRADDEANGGLAGAEDEHLPTYQEAKADAAMGPPGFDEVRGSAGESAGESAMSIGDPSQTASEKT